MCADLKIPLARQHGFSLIEVTVTLIVMSLMLGSFGLASSAVLEAREAARQKERLARDAALAMERMVSAVKLAPGLMLPLADNPATTQDEALREQFVPPPAGKESMTAVLAVRLSASIDRNADGIPDADNDGDGRIDEDPGADSSFDMAPGIVNIDDDNDGQADDGAWQSAEDDDEDGTANEDPAGLGDADKDVAVDEDPSGDLNNDKAPGIAGLDDDNDGLQDEGSALDDDEDGLEDEDWYDPVVFYLAGGNLVERQAFPADLDQTGGINGRDFLETIIAEDVAYFRVERIAGARATLVDLTLELRTADGESVSLNTRVRVGGSS